MALNAYDGDMAAGLHSALPMDLGLLPDATFHLQLNQPVHLDRVFHRQLFYEWLDKSIDDHRAGFLLSQTPT